MRRGTTMLYPPTHPYRAMRTACALVLVRYTEHTVDLLKVDSLKEPPMSNVELSCGVVCVALWHMSSKSSQMWPPGRTSSITTWLTPESVWSLTSPPASRRSRTPTVQNRMRVASPEWREPSRTAYLDRNDRNSVRVGGVTRHRSSGLFTIHGCVVQGGPREGKTVRS